MPRQATATLIRRNGDSQLCIVPVLYTSSVTMSSTGASCRAVPKPSHAIAMTTRSENERRRIPRRAETLDVLKERYGQALDTFWRDRIGHGLDALTEREAQHLCRQPTLAAMQDLVAKAAIEARGDGLEPVFRRDD